MRRFVLGAPAQAALILIMLLGCVFLWVGVPLGWLWIGSQVQASASVDTAVLVTLLGAVVTIVVVAPLLARLNRIHVELREARDQPVGKYSVLEVMLVVSAGIAVLGFGIWFFGFAGSSPLPLNLSY
jgi:hypothetical protein